MGRKPGNFKLPPNPGSDQPVKIHGWTIYGRELEIITQVMERYHLTEASSALRLIINEYDRLTQPPASPPEEQS